MSSVIRTVARPLTRNFKAYNGVYYGTLDYMKTYFTDNGGVVDGGFVMFPTAVAAAQAIYDLEGPPIDPLDPVDYEGRYPGGYTDNGIEIWNDLGHELKVGVVGGKSDYFTYRLMKYATNKYNLGAGPTNGVFYVLVDSQPTHEMADVLNGYGEVYAGRNY